MYSLILVHLIHLRSFTNVKDSLAALIALCIFIFRNSFFGIYLLLHQCFRVALHAGGTLP